MKKLLITTLIIGLIASTPRIIAEMRYNPLNNILYSYPETPDINQNEYLMLLFGCAQIEARLMAMNNGKQASRKTLFDQCSVYLNAIGTPTALRLIGDLKSNKIHYANGSFMKKIFP